jgi:hypothetical protein
VKKYALSFQAKKYALLVLGPSYRAYRPAQEQLAAAKEKSAPLKPIPI